MRNKEKDEAQIALKKQRLIEVGFRLFAEKGIEQVKIPQMRAVCRGPVFIGILRRSWIW